MDECFRTGDRADPVMEQEVGRRSRGHRVEQRHSERRPRLLGRVDHRARHAGVARVHPYECRAAERHERGPHPEADYQLGRKQVRQVVRVDPDAGEQEEPEGSQYEPGHHHHLRAQTGEGCGSKASAPPMIPRENGKKAKPVRTAEYPRVPWK